VKSRREEKEKAASKAQLIACQIIIPANRKIKKTLLRTSASVQDHIEIDPGRPSQDPS